MQVFNFNEHAVRIIMCDGEPWWIAKDVCDVLELADVTSALRGLDDDEKTREQLINIQAVLLELKEDIKFLKSQLYGGRALKVSRLLNGLIKERGKLCQTEKF